MSKTIIIYDTQKAFDKGIEYVKDHECGNEILFINLMHYNYGKGKNDNVILILSEEYDGVIAVNKMLESFIKPNTYIVV